MREGNPVHLTPEQAFAMASGRLPDADSQRHAEECADCRGLVTEWELWFEKVNSGGGEGHGSSLADTNSCLTPAELTALTDGGADGVRDGALAHLSRCSRCSETLREAMLSEELSQEEQEFAAGMRTSSAEWQHRAAADLTTIRMPSRKPLPRWMAAAAMVVVCVGAAWWAVRGSGPGWLLSRAYTANRPFDYRLPGASYGQPPEERRDGSSLGRRSISLSLADIWMQLRSAAGSSGAQDEVFNGRLELLEHNYDGAADSFESVRKANPGDDKVEEELACAFALRKDYPHASNLLEDLLKRHPKDPEILFNAAVVYEEWQQYGLAILKWQAYLNLNDSSDWVKEAKTHLHKDQGEVGTQLKKQGRITENPQRFLALMNSNATEVEPERYLEVFWAKWLPEVRTNPAVHGAAVELGRTISDRFHDDSVNDAVAQAIQTDAGPELKRLGEMLTGSIEERNDAALAEGQELLEALRARGQTVARIRAAHELSYNFNRAGNSKACLRLEEEQLHLLEGTSYLWLRGLVGLQHATCVGWGFDLSTARAETVRIRSWAHDTGLRYLELKAATLLVSIDQVSGDYAQVLKNAPTALAEYWDSGASDFRAQSLIHDLRVTASAMNLKDSAVALEQATVFLTVRATELSRNKILLALNRGDLAAVLAEAGYRDDALQELSLAEGLLNAAEPGPTLQIDRKVLALQRAEMQASGASPAEALATLNEIANWPESAGIEDRLRIYQARGLAQRATGDNAGAEASFREAIRLHREHLATRTVAQRLAASTIARESYRNLVDLQLHVDHDFAGALRTWESYRELLDGQRSSDSALALRGTPALIYAALPSGVAVWVRSPAGLRAETIRGSQDEMRRESEALMDLVSSPSSSVTELRADAAKLYEQLIGPIETELGAAETVCVEADDWMGVLPFGLLVNRRGNYLASLHPISMITSLRDAAGAGGAGRFSVADRALIVSAPSPIAPSGERLPMLRAARDETSWLRQRMPTAVLLEDEEASNEALTREIPRATLFHFAGHGWANGGNGGLLLEARYDEGSSQPGPAWIGADQLAAQDWTRCRLAVLSACLTATGEEHGPVNNQSLVRALLAAGAQRVVAARWSVDSDATRALMEGFYDALFAGAAPAKALASAEMGVSAVKGWGHPYYWGGFDVFGRQ